MYIRDLTPLSGAALTTVRGQFQLDALTPVVFVGWLGNWRPYSTGVTSAEFQERLVQICASPSRFHRGIFRCRQGRCKLRMRSECGAGEILVVGAAHVFLAPSLIGHYVTDHAYRPPDAFIEAVLEAEGPPSGPGPEPI